MEQIKRAFDATASRYDGQRKWIIPEMDDYYSAAVWAAECKNPCPAILDIGAGTGLLSALMTRKFPDAQLTLVDLSESMLSIAQERFADRKNVRYITGDYSSVDFAGRYDLICSALSIHHLGHEDKYRLYRKIYNALNPGGMFVNADQVLGETAAINRRYMNYWDEFLVPCPLSTEDKKQMLYRRDTFDKNEKLSVQLGWMADCGFSEIDLIYKNRLFVVFTGRKD
ncbi:MAG: class I SAM-dependent methyltransferase [Methanomicrobiales archaeon HGW-Methanomicrobiales-1]|jgi:tRNA (cmo5U34)-methyltransferase|nr:MAG: class I SAM-dependent methyltransferase [Methanomicrobiales archaeon HGW-Methanomicrobiales-1]